MGRRAGRAAGRAGGRGARAGLVNVDAGSAGHCHSCWSVCLLVCWLVGWLLLMIDGEMEL